MAFHKAVKTGNKLRMALTGPAGSGKTYTALAIATALGGRVAVLDTEHGSASKYADLFDFDTATLNSFSIDNYISSIQEAEAAGYGILIIDSLSHAWAGRDGALEEVDRLKRASRSGDAFSQGWSQVTPKQNRLVDTIIAAKMHVIATLRTKMAYEIEAGANGRTAPKKVGLAPIQREGVEYEFDVVGDLDPDHIMRVTKTRCIALTDKAFDRAGADVAAILKTWLADAAPQTAKQPPAAVVVHERPAPHGNGHTDDDAALQHAADLAAIGDLFRALRASDAVIGKTLDEYVAADVRGLTPENAAKLRTRLEAAVAKKRDAQQQGETDGR